MSRGYQCASVHVAGHEHLALFSGAEARLRLCPTCLDTLKEAVSAATWDSPLSCGLVSLCFAPSGKSSRRASRRLRSCQLT